MCIIIRHGKVHLLLTKLLQYITSYARMHIDIKSWYSMGDEEKVLFLHL